MFAQASAKSYTPEAALAHAKELLSTSPLVDGHNDLPWAIREDKNHPRDVDAYDLRKRTPHQTDLARMREGKLGGQFWSVYIPGEVKDSGSISRGARSRNIRKRSSPRRRPLMCGRRSRPAKLDR
jgi:membrane dipeptidase